MKPTSIASAVDWFYVAYSTSGDVVSVVRLAAWGLFDVYGAQESVVVGLVAVPNQVGLAVASERLSADRYEYKHASQLTAAERQALS